MPERPRFLQPIWAYLNPNHINYICPGQGRGSGEQCYEGEEETAGRRNLDDLVAAFVQPFRPGLRLSHIRLFFHQLSWNVSDGFSFGHGNLHCFTVDRQPKSRKT